MLRTVQYLQDCKIKPVSLPTPVQVAKQPDNGYLGFKKAKEIVDFDVVCWAVWESTVQYLAGLEISVFMVA